MERKPVETTRVLDRNRRIGGVGYFNDDSITGVNLRVRGLKPDPELSPCLNSLLPAPPPPVVPR